MPDLHQPGSGVKLETPAWKRWNLGFDAFFWPMLYWVAEKPAKMNGPL
jgi:hypothetical protein